VFIFAIFAAQAQDSPPAPDVSAVRPGPARVETAPGVLTVSWPDEAGRPWQLTFSLDARPALIRSVSVAGKPVVESLSPVYSA
jgi:hypothetical protein